MLSNIRTLTDAGVRDYVRVNENTPTLMFIVGPPAVGKMTVGTELAARTGLRLLHNHMTIDLVIPFFAFGTPPFNRLVRQFRRLLLEEAAMSDLPGVIFTVVWDFDDPNDEAAISEWSEIFLSKGGRVLFVELEAPLETRLQRNETEFRLSQKPLKRDLEESRRQVLSSEGVWRMNSGGRFDGRPDYFRVDNTALSAAEVADRVVGRFGLPLGAQPKA